ncbi:MAG TPA: hypothetical protein VFT74_11715, partial [Isosphaeraceae bacterium]|nr:hypothetical protein [Isosphaeraceae bacterium]
MPTEDETIRLRLDVGQYKSEAKSAGAEVDVLAKKHQTLERELKDLDDAFSRGTVKLQHYREEHARLNKAVASSQKAIDAATRAQQATQNVSVTTAMVTNRLAEETKKSGQSAMMSGMGWMYLAQTLDDAQYGFRAIVNNIPMVVGSLTGSQSLAGAAGIAAVAINLNIQRMDDWKNVMREFQDVIPTDKLEQFGRAARSVSSDFGSLSFAATGGYLNFDFFQMAD